MFEKCFITKNINYNNLSIGLTIRLLNCVYLMNIFFLSAKHAMNRIMQSLEKLTVVILTLYSICFIASNIYTNMNIKFLYIFLAEYIFSFIFDHSFRFNSVSFHLM